LGVSLLALIEDRIAGFVPVRAGKAMPDRSGRMRHAITSRVILAALLTAAPALAQKLPVPSPLPKHGASTGCPTTYD